MTKNLKKNIKLIRMLFAVNNGYYLIIFMNGYMNRKILNNGLMGGCGRLIKIY